MAAQKTVDKNILYSLIPLEDFKAILGIDDREDGFIPAALHCGILPCNFDFHD
jgi:hypothetical protein